MANFELSPELKSYDLKPTCESPKIYIPGFGELDLRIATLQDIQQIEALEKQKDCQFDIGIQKKAKNKSGAE